MTTRHLSLPCILRPSRVQTVGLLLVCLGFVGIGSWMIHDGERRGYLVAGFFALGVPVFALQFHPRAAYLRLDETGFAFCSLFRVDTVRWTEVADFGVIRVGAGTLVAWNFVPGHPRTGHARAISQAVSGYEAALPSSYGLEPRDLAARMNAWRQRWEQPDAEPFFRSAEVARLVQGQPVGEPLPFDPADAASIRQFYEGLVRQIEREQGWRSRVEWNHYGSGYASFVEAWFYPADGRASLPPFRAGEERHVGLVVLLSRLSRYFVLGQDEHSWSPDGSGSGGMLNFSAVDDLTHAAILPGVVPLTALLTAAGLQRLSRQDLAARLPEDVQVPTILTDQPFRQFDALFHWED